MYGICRALVATAVIGAGIHGAWSQQALRLRVSIVAFDGRQIAIATGDGKKVAVALPENVNVAITRPFTLADVKPGMALGVTTVQQADGATVAIDLRPIPATANLGLSL